ncbi:MAG: SusC/RagA family TonB-linked outer membrane protein [Bacteroidaceae bacterium]|nr:SusC/RagA family TonB-linked outer membrane protein [Bacteroidaceae bacterium]
MNRSRLLAAVLCALLSTGVLATFPVTAYAQTPGTQSSTTATGVVSDENGDPIVGAYVVQTGTRNGVMTDTNGRFSLKNVAQGAQIRVTYLGYEPQTVRWNGTALALDMKPADNTLNAAVVTAMGIVRKERSLTYSTQQIKANELTIVPDANVANTLEGKVSGITITTAAGGAGGTSKIIMRGQKSILGNSTPLIVVDGVPMNNNVTYGGKLGMGDGGSITAEGRSEGADPLSMINPDDIESMNVLKGANAAALYGSQAANGVVMITTKKGREGKIDVNFTTNVTFETPLLTPKIQTIYGADLTAGGGLAANGWGAKITDRPADQLVITTPFASGSPFQTAVNPNSPDVATGLPSATYDIHLRNKGHNDVDDFFRTGTTFNNSISLSGGTEKIKTYFSYANSHTNGMIENNSYNRNTLAFRQSYKLWKRVSIDASLNYVQTVTRNRPGGGGLLNPIYHLYTTPNNVDMGYYKNHYTTYGQWYNSTAQSLYQKTNVGGKDYWELAKYYALLSGPRQEWAYMAAPYNNPYWLTNMNNSKQKTERVYGSFTGKVDIIDGLAFQARLGMDYSRFNSDTKRYATTFLQSGYLMNDYGMYYWGASRRTELYTDYLLSYNKQLNEDWSLSATAGYVGHTTKSKGNDLGVSATWIDGMHQIASTQVNRFQTDSGDAGALGNSSSSDWDQAALFTAQVGWRDKIYVDASYRQDWYKAFKQFHVTRGTSISYGYWGVGANAIVSELLKMPEWINYLKYRASYSQVGNSIPNTLYNMASASSRTDAVNLSGYNRFENPVPEKTSSFETGIEMMLLDNRMNFDFTFYNAIADHLYMTVGVAGKTTPVNSAKVRNTGFEATLGYTFHFGEWRWKPQFNVSFDDNKILRSAYKQDGSENPYCQALGGATVIYKEGGSVGDLYVTDFKRDENGVLILNRTTLAPQYDNLNANSKYVGNMNSKWQLGWSNTINWKNFQLFFLINGRIGGKVISQTEGYLDNLGLSQRTAKARLYAEQHGIYAADGRLGMYIHGKPGTNGVEGDYIVAIEDYYTTIGGSASPTPYIYKATNFRLRELSLSYTFRNLIGENKNLTLSFVGRNLFFLYKDAPVDPDISLSTTNGLGGFEYFSMPSARSFGFSAKLNF